jgi:Lon protease-like protein
MSAKSADESAAAIPAEIPLFPLGTVLFPGGLLPLKVFEQRYVDMTKACLRDNTPFGVCLIKEGHEVGQPAAPHAIGCLAHIAQWDVPHPNLFAVLARGSTRFRVLDTTVTGNGLITARIETLPEPTQPGSVDRACQEVLRLAIERAGVESVPGPVRLDDPVWVSYRLAEILPIPAQDKQALLELTDTGARLTQLHDLLLAHGIIENINKNN